MAMILYLLSLISVIDAATVKYITREMAINQSL